MSIRFDEPVLSTIDLLSGAFSPQEFDYSTLKALEGIQAPSVFIGLGGGGTNAVAFLKQLFSKTFAAKMREGAGELPPGYQFLAFDSDKNARPSNLRPNSEWIHLAGSGLGRGVWDKFRKRPGYRDWLASDVSYSEFATGCRGYRNLGRFLFQKNISTVQQKLTAAIQRSTSYFSLPNSDIQNFYLFCTLAGGTGSGCLLDIAFLLRNIFPDTEKTKIHAFLGCAHGFTPADHVLMERAKTGVYAALREVNFFMSDSCREKWIDELESKQPAGYVGTSGDAQRGTFSFAGSGTLRGCYAKPFDLCYLFGHKNQAGVTLLPESADMSRFMARTAFALTAYPVPSSKDKVSGSQSFASNVNNISDSLDKEPGGAPARFIVPGIASLHAPLGEAFDVLQIDAALGLLRDMQRGFCNREDRREAQEFLHALRSNVDQVRQFLGLKLDYRLPLDQPALERNEKTLRTGERYKTSLREDILQSFRNSLETGNIENCVSDHRKALWAQKLKKEQIRFDERNVRLTPLTVQESLADFRDKLIDECNRQMTAINRRKVAVEDFVNDLQLTLDDMIETARKAVEGAGDTYAAWVVDWKSPGKNDSGFFARLLNVTSKTGLVDAAGDYWTVGTVAAEYKQNATAAHEALRERVLASLSWSYLNDLKAIVENWQQQLNAFFAASSQAERELSRHRRTLVSALHEQEHGRGWTDNMLDTAFSFNLMTDDWRREFAVREKLEDVSVLQGHIQAMIDDKNRAALEVGGDAGRSWRPLDVIAASTDESVNPRKASLEKLIAYDICHVLHPWFDRRRKTFGELRDGAGLRGILEYLDPLDGRGEPALKERSLYLKGKCQPQWDISMNDTNLPGNSTRSLSIFSGPNALIAQMARQAQLHGEVNLAQTYEANRITMISFSFPVGLPGCPEVADPLRATHDQHIRMLEEPIRAKGEAPQIRRRFYCFPNAWFWPDPADVLDEGEQAAEELFAKLYAIGNLPQWPALDTTAKQLFVQMLDELAKLKSGPKGRSIGLYRRGTEELWYCPFAPIEWDQGSFEPFSAPVRLGTNLQRAFAAFHDKAERQDDARQWVDWFDSVRSSLFDEEQYAAFVASQIEDLEKFRKKREPNSKSAKIVASMQNALNATL